jgi:hypothetical protein
MKSILCRIGWHRWSIWAPPIRYPHWMYPGHAVEVIQMRECIRCGFVEHVKIGEYRTEGK